MALEGRTSDVSCAPFGSNSRKKLNNNSFSKKKEKGRKLLLNVSPSNKDQANPGRPLFVSIDRRNRGRVSCGTASSNVRCRRLFHILCLGNGPLQGGPPRKLGLTFEHHPAHLLTEAICNPSRPNGSQPSKVSDS